MRGADGASAALTEPGSERWARRRSCPGTRISRRSVAGSSASVRSATVGLSRVSAQPHRDASAPQAWRASTGVLEPVSRDALRALAQPLTARPREEERARCGTRRAEGVVDRELPRRRVEQIHAAEHVGDPHRGVVNGDGELVREEAVAAANDEGSGPSPEVGSIGPQMPSVWVISASKRQRSACGSTAARSAPARLWRCQASRTARARREAPRARLGCRREQKHGNTCAPSASRA